LPPTPNAAGEDDDSMSEIRRFWIPDFSPLRYVFVVSPD
jgi:hypothetical protein